MLNERCAGCALVDLAPLTREDAVLLADSAGVHGEAMIEEAVERRAGALASVPLTLELLVRGYQRNGMLAEEPARIFAEGVGLLAEEHDQGRRHARRFVTGTTWRQRLRVAGRVAARMVLSGHRTLWKGTKLDGVRPGYDLDVAALAGGHENTGAHQRFDVTPQILEEALRTGLFTPQDECRISFRHSSLAAYLTAEHLIHCQVTEPALRALFLVGVSGPGDTEGARIPAPLRETAAWLVALDPAHTQWLAAADPESLTVHSGLVRSDAVKELTVRRLLERAEEVELSPQRREFTHRSLSHPALPDQLAAALAIDPGGPPDDWLTRARVRTALKLAEDCPSPRLTTTLLGIARDTRWPQGDRRMAARAAFSCDEERAAPALREILDDSACASSAQEHDPDGDMLGTVLLLLWPKFIELSAVLPKLRPVRNTSYYGTYRHFLRGMADGCAEEQVRPLLRWLAARPFGGEEHGLDGLEDAAIDRALRCRDMADLWSDLAMCVLRRVDGGDKPAFPAVLDGTHEDDDEPADVRVLRRSLASALLRALAQHEGDRTGLLHAIQHGWEGATVLRDPQSRAGRTRLLSGRDFAWALMCADDADADGDEELADICRELAANLFREDDPEHCALAYARRDGPLWPHVHWAFDAVPLHGRQADWQRRAYRRRHPERWHKSASFVADQERRMRRCREGWGTDGARGAGGVEIASEFVLLLWNMQIDPERDPKRQTRPFGDNPQTWPGAGVFSSGELDALPEYALRYLETGGVPEDSGTPAPLWNWTARIALAVLVRAGRTGQLRSDVWRRWSAAVVEIDLSAPPGEEEMASVLRRCAATRAPEDFARYVEQRARAELEAGDEAFELRELDPGWSAPLRSMMERLLAELNGRPEEPLRRTWADLLHRLTMNGSDPARDLAVRTVTEQAAVAEPTDLPPEFPAVAAALALLAADARRDWSWLERFLVVHPRFSRALAEACGRWESARADIERSADEGVIVHLYHWLNFLRPEDDIPAVLGMHEVSAEEQVGSWRESLPRSLAARGTWTAVRCLEELSGSFPRRLSLRAAVVAARAQCLAASWTPADLDQVVRMLAEGRRGPNGLQDEGVELLLGISDMDALDFRQGILADVRRYGYELSVPESKNEREHLRAIFRAVDEHIDPPGAAQALYRAVVNACPGTGALPGLKSLLAP